MEQQIDDKNDDINSIRASVRRMMDKGLTTLIPQKCIDNRARIELRRGIEEFRLLLELRSLDKAKNSSKIRRNPNKRRALRWHPDGLESWSLNDWLVAVVGELGEMCNVAKKLRRAEQGLVGNKESFAELRANLQEEFADVYIYLDLLAQRERINVSEAVRAKFNEVSERNGFPERL